jgi:hypothetical protein
MMNAQIRSLSCECFLREINHRHRFLAVGSSNALASIHLLIECTSFSVLAEMRLVGQRTDSTALSPLAEELAENNWQLEYQTNSRDFTSGYAIMET